VHKDAIFNSVITVGGIPIFSSLINARASVCPVLMAWICSFDRAVRFRAHNTFAEQKVVALHPRQATEVSCCARCLFFFQLPILSSRTSHLCVSWFLAGRIPMVYFQSLLIPKRFVCFRSDDTICLFSLFRLSKLLIYLFMSNYGQLPDYHDIIKHPMDFSTIRKKLDKGAYSNLEQFEVGYRICMFFYWIFLQSASKLWLFAL
jgi:hypothetical protein